MPAHVPACRTLAGLDLPHSCREVVDKDASAVLDEVEAAIYLVAASILRGEGFSYDIPSRAKGNQVCKIEAASVRGHIWATFWGAWYDRVCMTSAMLSCCPVSLMYQGCRSVDCKARTSGQWHAATQGKVWLRYDSQWVCSQDACTLYIHHAWGGCWQYGNVLLSVQLYVPQLDRIVLRDATSQRPFASTSTCRKAGACPAQHALHTVQELTHKCDPLQQHMPLPAVAKQTLRACMSEADFACMQCSRRACWAWCTSCA